MMEKAALEQPRHVGMAMRHMKNIKAGIPCVRCTTKRAQLLVSGQTVCRACADAVLMDARVKRQKETAAAMRPRR